MNPRAERAIIAFLCAVAAACLVYAVWAIW
jgi:hypothetical protein